MEERGVVQVAWRIGAMVWVLALAAQPTRAEVTDYTAGKTPAQLFSSDCSACHQSPRGLAKNLDQRSLTGFLREHYTTKAESAGALAAYLIGNPGPAAAGQRGQAATHGSRSNAPRPAAAVGHEEPERAKTEEKPHSAAREHEKPADQKKRASKRKKNDAAEAAREAAEAAKAAEEAEKAKVRAYATTGEEAIPRVVAAPASEPPISATPEKAPVAAAPSTAPTAPDAESATTTGTAPTENASPGTAGQAGTATEQSSAAKPSTDAPSASAPSAAAPAPETPASGTERPAQVPPG